MRKIYCALFVFMLLTACTSTTGISTTQGNPVVTATGSHAQGTGEEQQLAQRLLKQINQDRATNNFPPLAWEPLLEQSAHQHDLVMAAGCGLMHQCPNEADLGTRISKQGVQWQTVGENIGDGGPISSNDGAWNMVTMLHQGMMGEKPPDDGHRRNLLSQDFHRIGINVYIDAKQTLWLTEDFAN